jgi:hypothetical protein
MSRVHMVALYTVWYKTLRVTPAMAAGLTDRLMSIEDVFALIDAREAAPKKRGPYRRRLPAPLHLPLRHRHFLAAAKAAEGEPEEALHRSCNRFANKSLFPADYSVIVVRKPLALVLARKQHGIRRGALL